MRWRADGWPEMGEAIDAKGCGRPVLEHARPQLAPDRPAAPASSDSFSSSKLGYQWQWQGNPQSDWAQIDSTRRRLHLRCVSLANAASHWDAVHLLLQKLPAPSFTVDVGLRLETHQDGDCAGLIVFGCDYGWIGLRRLGGRLQAVLQQCRNAHEGGHEHTLAHDTPSVPAGEVQVSIRRAVSADALCRFALSWNGTDYREIGPPFAARSSRWVGAKFGLFASTTSPHPSTGTAALDPFQVRPPNPSPPCPRRPDVTPTRLPRHFHSETCSIPNVRITNIGCSPIFLQLRARFSSYLAGIHFFERELRRAQCS